MQGRTYRFLSNAEFERLLTIDLANANRIYATEVLARAHWAAACSLLRHRKWMNAILAECEARNFLGFTACLRGLIESAADSCYTLRNVPHTLASCYQVLLHCLSGTNDQITMFGDLEHELIHFHYARKVGKSESAPKSHNVKPNAEYMKSLDVDGHAPINQLYERLCEFTHPSSSSVLFLTDMVGNLDGNRPEFTVTIVEPNGDKGIRMMCESFKDQIERAVKFSVNTNLLILKTLNRFPLPKLHTRFVDGVDMNHMHGWQRINELISQSSDSFSAETAKSEERNRRGEKQPHRKRK